MDWKSEIRNRIRFFQKDTDTPVFSRDKGIPVSAEFFLMGVKMNVAFRKNADLNEFRVAVDSDPIRLCLLDADTVLKDDGLITGCVKKSVMAVVISGVRTP